MHKLPVVSAAETIKCFEKIGYAVTRQKGSHVRLHHACDGSKKPLTIPRHKVLGKGLLRKVIRDAELTVDEFTALL